MGDKDERSLLQRRGRRRISIPSSPISPSYPRRNDRSLRSTETPSIIEASSVADALPDQPSIDLTIPSPSLDGPPFASFSTADNGQRLRGVHMAVTDDSDKRKSTESIENARWTMPTGRGTEGRGQSHIRPTYLSELNTRSSPIIGRTSEGRDRNYEASVSAGRNYSTTSLSTEKSASDENVSTKVSTTKKSRLNLLNLNPMTLIARRRSSNNTKLEDMNISVSPLVPAIPENFDPSIRGNFVHDFTTPRNKRYHFENSPRREAFSTPANLRRPSDFGSPATNQGNCTSPVLHSPMFKEHFQDDENTLQPGQTAYLHNIASTRKLFDVPSPASLPSFAKNLPTIIPEPEDATEPEKVNGLKESPRLEIPHPDGPPPPPPPPNRTPSPNLDFLSTSAMPKHMTSVSSRFSFVVDQASSDQEKLLEERHKEHFSKDAKLTDEPEVVVDDGYDYEFDGDIDYEEGIPGVNTGFDEDDGFYNDDIQIKNIDVQSSQKQEQPPYPSLQGFHFTPTSPYSAPSPYNASEPTPRDMEGFRIGIADTKDSPVNSSPTHTLSKVAGNTVLPLFFEGLRISTSDRDKAPQTEITPPPESFDQAFDDSELYFDDGEFDMGEIDPDEHFDENLLDDETGPIPDIPAKNAKRYELALERSAPSDQIMAVDPNNTGLSRDTSSSSNFVDVHGGDSSGYSGSREPEANHGLSSHTSVLTEDNLAAYHDALAEAAQYAAANGKFNRQVSFSSDLSDEVEQHQSLGDRSNILTSKNRPLVDAGSERFDDDGAFAFDDDCMDDLMIAEANAQTLENDDEGFYGQEFGFYARAHGKDVSDLVNGGFFAARGSNGVKRSHSGKANFQEPSLTPITERSEWSTRNSIASLPMPGGIPGVGQSLPSPGISQILDSLDSPSFEEEMSLPALMKLRRGAFGGSSTSINSLGERSMPGSSPLGHMSSYSFPPPESNYLSKQVSAGGTSIMESEEEDQEEQLTLTQNTPRKKITGTSPSTPHISNIHLMVTESPVTSRKSHHRRNSSGADSVSYVRDTDGQWVLERRRTADDGAQEIVEREYLAGARI